MPPDLKGTLGTLIRTTINQVGAMTDVAKRQARTQKQRLDTALLERRRRDALADLGETLYELAESGEIEIDELPELARAVQEVADIDRRIAEAEEAARGRADGRRPVRLGRTGGTATAQRGSRQRENPRGRPDRDRPGARERVWRPPMDPEPDGEDQAQAGTDEADGEAEREFEVTPPPPPTRAPHSPGNSQRERPGATPSSTPPGHGSTSASTGERNGGGGGGIVFIEDDAPPADIDPDEALESYMNDDDVPRRR